MINRRIASRMSILRKPLDAVRAGIEGKPWLPPLAALA
jgi:hypothetical protein